MPWGAKEQMQTSWHVAALKHSPYASSACGQEPHRDVCNPQKHAQPGSPSEIFSLSFAEHKEVQLHVGLVILLLLMKRLCWPYGFVQFVQGNGGVKVLGPGLTLCKVSGGVRCLKPPKGARLQEVTKRMKACRCLSVKLDITWQAKPCISILCLVKVQKMQRRQTRMKRHSVLAAPLEKSAKELAEASQFPPSDLSLHGMRLYIHQWYIPRQNPERDCRRVMLLSMAST